MAEQEKKVYNDEAKKDKEIISLKKKIKELEKELIILKRFIGGK